MPMTRMTVVGEALVDVIRDGTQVRRHAGGSPMNVAVGLARLGHDTTLVARMGSDADGALLQEHLAAAGVRLPPGAVDDGPTSVAVATLDAAGRADYEFTLDPHLPSVSAEVAPDHVHTGSIAVFLDPSAAQVDALVREHAPHATVSLDPNVRPVLLGPVEPARRRVLELVDVSDVVKVSDEDLGWLEPGQDVLDVARAWLARGPALVVVTLGALGAVAVCRQGEVRVTAPRIDLVDTVGAGDSFTSGLLDGLAAAGLLGAAGLEALRAVGPDVVTTVVEQGVRTSAITCSRPGADPPTRAELLAWTAPYPDPSPSGSPQPVSDR